MIVHPQSIGLDRLTPLMTKKYWVLGFRLMFKLAAVKSVKPAVVKALATS